MKKKKYILKEKVRNTVELWVAEVDEEGKVIQNILVIERKSRI